jgi:hypothetical protein
LITLENIMARKRIGNSSTTKLTEEAPPVKNDVRDFLTSLATDPAKLGTFIKDPDGSMSAAGLTAEDQAILKSGNPGAIYARLDGRATIATASPAVLLVVDVPAAGESVAEGTLALRLPAQAASTGLQAQFPTVFPPHPQFPMQFPVHPVVVPPMQFPVAHPVVVAPMQFPVVHPQFPMQFPVIHPQFPQIVPPTPAPFPQIHPQLVVHPQIHPQVVVHPQIHPQLVVHPQIHPQVVVHPQILPQLVVHPQIHPQVVVHPQILPQLVVHPQIHPQLVVQPQIHPLLIPNPGQQ